ncbi:Hypothetical predicted protein [Podarcis lilfordi]|uniref:Uncharacterized protein n=1 Tax=Podarcis lilfordi TaxID=74358 RepID=A0AA35PDK0_9SAUR|nr:Hypothetical predicted protein [Podarcis lilfordi]
MRSCNWLLRHRLGAKEDPRFPACLPNPAMGEAPKGSQQQQQHRLQFCRRRLFASPQRWDCCYARPGIRRGEQAARHLRASLSRFPSLIPILVPGKRPPASFRMSRPLVSALV